MRDDLPRRGAVIVPNERWMKARGQVIRGFPSMRIASSAARCVCACMAFAVLASLSLGAQAEPFGARSCAGTDYNAMILDIIKDVAERRRLQPRQQLPAADDHRAQHRRRPLGDARLRRLSLALHQRHLRGLRAPRLRAAGQRPHRARRRADRRAQRQEPHAGRRARWSTAKGPSRSSTPTAPASPHCSSTPAPA